MAFPDSRPDFSPHWLRAIRSPLFLSIAGLWLLLFVLESARPRFFLHDDNATWFSGAYVHDFRVLTETGRWAEVNFNQYGGEPFLEQGQSAVLYPPVYLGVALAKSLSGDTRWSIEWIAAMHLTLGLLGFNFWLRQGGIAPSPAALGGLAWVLNPFVLLVAPSWIMVTYAAAWLPWLFWALDRLLAQPSLRPAFFLGLIAALFFLQGYVQWMVYAIVFLGLYALLRFLARTKMRRVAIVYYLMISMLLFLALTLPLFLPMLHAMDASAARATPFPLERALEYRVMRGDLIRAQFCLFRPHLIFGLSTAVLYCPALLFYPAMIVRFFYAAPLVRQRLFPFLILAVVALVFSSRWHFFLTILPLLEKFRWPFKMFLLADFFLLASLVWSVSSWATDRAPSAGRAHFLALLCLASVVLAELTVSLSRHDENLFSQAILPASNPVPPGLDSRLGRVIAIGQALPETLGCRFLTHGYSTYFEAPSLGGYNPLVSRAQLRYSLGLDFPNLFRAPITPEIRTQLDALAVRYWFIDAHSPQLQQVEALPGFRPLDSDPDRIVLEDTEALPLAYSASDPAKPCALTYSGNSMLISLAHATSPVEVSVGPADGWWYRIDHGPWLKPVYQNDRLRIDFQPPGQILEVSYFDPRFRQGLFGSGLLLLVLGLGLVVGRRFFMAKIALPER